MLLACDIGNTRIKAGFIEADNLVKSGSFEGFDEFEHFIINEKIDSVAFSSVSPEKSKELLEFITSKFKLNPFQVTHNSKFNLKIDYTTPETLGIDRICSAEGAYYLFNNSGNSKDYNKSTFIISIDLGTATTINFVDYPGAFIGGMILPGMDMMFNSLNKNTAQLPVVTPGEYKGLIGDTTNSSIASGVINSITGLFEKTISDLKKNLGIQNIHIYLTGGNAEKIIPYLNFENEYVKDLVLIGVKAVYEKNFKY
ncbi:MAG TPA: type III pantothenate kinase [Ignavibacteriaceae bacterium]|nr:type III pantothenate kinase [Ignavibacteriaceae bacterium]